MIAKKKNEEDARTMDIDHPNDNITIITMRGVYL